MAGIFLALYANLDLLATFFGGLFSGSTLYITTNEMPAIAEVGVDENWRFFPPMYKRALVSQCAYCAVISITSILHGLQIINSEFDRNLWILSGIAIASLFPYTYICVVPTNDTIIDDVDRMKLGQKSRFNEQKQKALLHKWSWLHFVRTAVAFVTFGAMVYGVSRRTTLVFKS